MSTAAQQPLLHPSGAGSPPPYGTNHHQHHQYHHQHHHHHHNNHGATFVPIVPPPVVQPYYPGTTVVVVPNRRPRCRFCKAFIIAIVIWALVGAFFRHLFWCRHGWCHGLKYDRPHWSIGPGHQSTGYPIPPGIDLEACEEPLSDDAGPSLTTFEVDSASETVFLVSAGSWISGGVKVTTTAAERDTVKFSVTLTKYRNYPANTIVCRLKRNDGEFGVGIFNPSNPQRHYYDRVRYDVLVELPENHPILKRFETNVVNAVHQIDNLKDKILFKELSLHGSNGGIKSTSLVALNAEIRTSNGAIEGYYNATDHLVIATSNGRIDVNIDFNQQNADRLAPLSLTTSNAPLMAALSLHDLRSDSDAEQSEPSFHVDTRTTNGHHEVKFDDAPVNSLLSYRGSTTNGHASVTLHPTYEGKFTLNTHSKWFPAVVNQHRAEDPTGRGRRRVVRYNNVRGYVNGEVSWDGSNDGEGSVDLTTTNSKATLNL